MAWHTVDGRIGRGTNSPTRCQHMETRQKIGPNGRVMRERITVQCSLMKHGPEVKCQWMKREFA
jgi:hypothetical protein